MLVDFQSGIDRLEPVMVAEYQGCLDEVPGIFSLIEPMTGALDALMKLAVMFDIYVLSTSPWNNSTAASDKVEWIRKHFGEGEESVLYKRVIITHHKDLNKGDYLVDDRTKNGAGQFEGELNQFGTDQFKKWGLVLEYLLK